MACALHVPPPVLRGAWSPLDHSKAAEAETATLARERVGPSGARMAVSLGFERQTIPR